MRIHLVKMITIFALMSLLVTPVSAKIPETSLNLADISERNPAAVEDADSQAIYIVRLNQPAVASYSGGINGLDATSPQVVGGRKVDINSPAVKAYYEYLDEQQTALISSIEDLLGRPVNVRFQYIYVLNGFAVELTASEATLVRNLPGVVDVQRDVERELDTDISPEWIGATNLWDGDNQEEFPTKGEGIVIGVLDTGINHDHPSFAEVGGDGYVHDNPYGPGNYAPGSYCVVTDPTFCNDKLIGAWAFNPSSTNPEDTDGHGSHTSSTAGGNTHDAVFTVGTDVFTRTISGMAPHANIIAYQVCFPSCPSSSSIAAVNQSIADGADVLNYSISGGDEPWIDSVDLAFLDAFNAGIFVSASAGNDGPGEGTVAKTGGWNAAVGASSHSRVIANTLDVTAPTPVPPELIGLAAVTGTGPDIVSDIEADILWAGSVSPGNETGCSAFPANAFDNAIALIQRGGCTFAVKVTNATSAGAVAAVVFNNFGGPPITMGGLETTTIPAVFLDLTDGSNVRDWIIANPDTATARINASTALIIDDTWGDIMAGFSSRGPSQYNVLKPDFTAPGVNILAAADTTDPGDPPEYYFNQGTSMSSPHGAGSAALMMSLHPNWSPAMVKSAIALTALTDGVLKDDGATAAEPFDMGGGRVDLAAAGYAGFTLDETYENFVAANPLIGGDPTTLNLHGLQNNDCLGSCSWTRVITSTVDFAQEWDVSVTSPPSMTLSVNPSNFTLGAGMTQTIQVNATASGAVLGEWIFGNVDFTPAGPTDLSPAHFPVAVIFTADLLPPAIEVTPSSYDNTVVEGFTETLPLSITNLGDMDLTWQIEEDAGQTLQDWSDNFDSYPTDTNIHGLGGWKGWFNDPNAGAFVRDEFSISTPNSVEIIGASDLVHEYTGVNTGEWTYTAWQYVPSSLVGQSYFILLNNYNDDNIDLNWSTQVFFDGATDLVVNTGASGGQLPLITDQWVEIRVEIDLTNDTQDFYYNDQLLYSGTWTDEVSGDGALNLGAVDLFANAASAVYYDDLSLVEEGVEPPAPCEVYSDIPWLSTSPDLGTTPPDETSLVDVLFDASLVSTGTYTGTLCVESNDPVTPVVPVPVTMTVVAPAYGVEFVPVSSSLEATPGTFAEYLITLTNTGNVEDTFDITYSGNDPDWVVDVPTTSFTLEAGESTDVLVRVLVPVDALAGESDQVTVTATSQGDDTVSASVDLTTVAATVYDAELAPDTAEMSGAPGTTVEYLLTLTNTGNITGTFDVEFSGNDPAWLVEIPVSHFEDLAVGESVSVTVIVTIPAGVADGTSDSVEISVVSADDGLTKDTSVLTTTASTGFEGYLIFLPLIQNTSP